MHAMVFNNQDKLNNTIAIAILPTVCKIYAWKNAKMMIISKKINNKDLQNYRPICLLVNIYKAPTKVLMKKRPKKTHAENQPREQAGFRRGYSTTDHIHVVNQLKKKRREYNIPLCLRESLRFSANSINTDHASRTGDRRCIHRVFEGNLY